MKISYNWLKTLVSNIPSAEETAKLLTAAGLEVESLDTFESVQGGLRGLVVGEVVECSKHPDADRLNLTKVNTGNGELLSIVCGAANVAAGQKVIVATIGTKLYPSKGEPFEIKKSKIRGALSEGMLCAEDEIGMGESHDGIVVLPSSAEAGTPLAEFYKLEEDHIFEIGLTPNRSDAASHLGVARDLTAILAASSEIKPEVNIQGLQMISEQSGINTVEIEIKANEFCKRYSGLVISGVTIAESPDWLKNRLRSIDVRPINNIVDITNFVLHELGQPLHAFDLEKINDKKIIVRTAAEGEKFVTLDGVERTLKQDDLMICDSKAPLCIAGVFGGLNSGVTNNTTSIFLESAYFDPAAVRRSSKNHGLKTDASFRFERGTDPDMTVKALIRATNLITEIAGGVISMGITDVYAEKLEPYRVAFSYSNCSALIGKEIDRNTVKNILTALAIEIESEGSDGLLLSVPRFKTDVTREADIIEEVMRIYGYNNVEPGKMIAYSALQTTENSSVNFENKVSRLLEGFGFNEMMSLSLTKESYYSEVNSLVKVLNPLSNDLNVMRQDMLYSGLEAIAYNLNRRNSDLKFFEIGRTYSASNEAEFPYQEQKNISLFVCGRIFPQNPYGLNQSTDLFYLKSAVLNLIEKCGAKKIKSEESTYENFEYGLLYKSGNKNIATIGSVKKSILKKFDIQTPVYFANINWEVLLQQYNKLKATYEEISKFPSVNRDLALLLDKSVKYSQIEELAFATEKKYLKEVNLFDIYEGEKLGGKKSYAVSFTLMNQEATLTDKQIEGVMEKLVQSYKEKLGAELR